MDIITLYRSLPPRILTDVSEATGARPSAVRERLLSGDRAAWEAVRTALASLEEKVDTVTTEVETLLRDRIPA